ncbi:putative alpha/beta hydrolase family esterase [Neisseria perflava]|nr:putative alpha/beta hydrolase family esterase [Neisseria perflava]
MPHPEQPTAQAWQFALDRYIGKPDGDTFLVGHSLGCITLLHFLSRQQPEAVGGLVLAAGFADPLPPLPKLDDYIRASQPDFDVLNAIRMPKHCLVSDNDTHVPPALTLSMAERLHSPVTHIPKGGHLMASDGFTALPQAWEALKTMLDKPPA